MGQRSSINVLGKNRLIELLPPADSERILRATEQVDLEMKHVLFEPYQPIRYVYFPLSGVSSLVLGGGNAEVMEVGTTGNEGLVGVAVFLGAISSPMHAFQQVPGSALRMASSAFVEECDKNGALRKVVQAYTQGMFNMVAQSTVCNQLHPIEQRLSRWLLMTHDRAGADEFALTQEFMAQMLGARRPTVSVAAGMLSKSGLISYARGLVRVEDRQGLEDASCACYSIVRKEFERLLQ